MTIRARLALAAAAAVAIAVVTVSAIVYIVVRNELRGQVDAGLQTRAAFIRDAHEHRGEGGHRGRSRDADAGTEVAAAGRSDSGGPPGGD